ncbi:MAG TPA: DsrE/DsrF/DrsH-like family protein [Anaerolineae bacterium]|nr:DsrE/DsrF/DrsH-like family protein [Anaerolineae bacterium]
MEDTKRCSIVVFSGDMDKQFGAFIIATTAAAMGMETSMFFTFWGLQALKKKGLKTGQGLFGRMLGFMFKDIEGVGPSKMNFGGAGRWMFKKMMKEKGVASLLELRQAAIDLGVQLQPCQMSMDVMEIRREDMIDAVTDPVGAATYVLNAQGADITLFV